MRFVRGAVLLLLAGGCPIQAGTETHAEKLSYRIEWRLIRAGVAILDLKPGEARLKLDSAGLVSTLFKVDNTYTVRFDPPLCATSSLLDAQEGKRHRETAVTFDRTENRATFILRDVLKNAVLRTEQVEIPNCVHDIVGAIQALRAEPPQLGQPGTVPVSDGRKAAQVRVEAQEHEQVTTPAGTFKTIRYEANLFNGVVYTRKGRALVWLTDDARRLPVQMKLRMSFPLGTVTLLLQKEEQP